MVFDTEVELFIQTAATSWLQNEICEHCKDMTLNVSCVFLLLASRW